MSTVFPPSGPTVQTQTIPSYLYTQYNDDDNLQGFISAYNGMAQTYVDWFVNAGLPVYTLLSGALLDWVANGLYGIYRPTLGTPGTGGIGPINTMLINTTVINSSATGTAGSFYLASDDIFQRIMTWHLYKADGKMFTLSWLKRRVYRFLFGTNGTDVSVAYTGQISISIVTYTVTINLSAVTGVPTAILQAFHDAVESSALELPPQFSYTVTL